MRSNSALDIVYEKLDYKSGQLFNLTSSPFQNIKLEDWLNKGEWLIAAKNAGAEKIFFVQNNPVVVFANHHNKESIAEIYSKLWSLARPRILFLECEGELSVIDLAQKPIVKKGKKNLDFKISFGTINEVLEKIKDYHRDNIESGKIYEVGRFGDINNRADKSLIEDLKFVRTELLESGLQSEYAHALIGRSIFIRYLEDRGILDKEYFMKVAGSLDDRKTLLNNPTFLDRLDQSSIKALYPRVLEDKSFTYGLYKSLANDFNGDMFPNVEIEENHVKPKHLKIVQDLLYGNIGVQKKLFFYSYRFDIIPLDLISAIYEEFYHYSTETSEKKKKARQTGSYYTPPVLAEFVLSRVLTQNELKKTPRILDPACGSGIFLVEAFRRIARYKWKKKNAPLEFDELKEILRDQIRGIEINENAARITAFSLYLAMLHYLDPPSILRHIRMKNRLPNLIVTENKGKNHFNSIWINNAFEVSKKDLGEINIIVGNPPWGDPGKKADDTIRKQQTILLNWCKSKNYPIGDNEPSQAFLWLTTELLDTGGRCSLLTSAGVLFKHGTQTQEFRNKWMSTVCVNEVFNFSHVRKFFFKGADSPFLLIHFTNRKQGEEPVEYWSAKQVFSLKETQAVIFSKYDINYLLKQDFTDNRTWKVNWFGRHADTVFLKQIGSIDKLIDYVDRDKSGQGISPNPPKYSTQLLPNTILINNSFSRYAKELLFEPTPSSVYRTGKPESYFKNRLLIQRGVNERGPNKGEIVSRFETSDFCYTNAINSIKLKNNNESDYKLFLGILWSSTCRYYFFNITANWGLWHHEIHLDDELLQLPIPGQPNKKILKKIISTVDKLRNYQPQEGDLFHNDGVSEQEIESQRRKWEKDLDEAVFDLYGFNEEQRDLIRDCCEVTIPFFYQPFNSIGVNPVIEKSNLEWIQHYTDVFANRWKPYLNEKEVLRADVHLGASGNMLAVEFYPSDPDDNWDLKPKQNTWEYILEQIGNNLKRPMGTSQIILEGLVQVVTDDSILVIKRNEKRFWTKSLAREDAESTIQKRMMETMPKYFGRD